MTAFYERVFFDLNLAKHIMEEYGLLAISFITNMQRPELSLKNFRDYLTESMYKLTIQELGSALDVVNFFIPKLEEDIRLLRITGIEDKLGDSTCTVESLVEIKSDLTKIFMDRLFTQYRYDLDSVAELVEKHAIFGNEADLTLDGIRYDFMIEGNDRTVLKKNLNTLMFTAMEKSLVDFNKTYIYTDCLNVAGFQVKKIFKVNEVLSSSVLLKLEANLDKFLDNNIRGVLSRGYTIAWNIYRQVIGRLYTYALEGNHREHAKAFSRILDKFSKTSETIQTFDFTWEINSIRFDSHLFNQPQCIETCIAVLNQYSYSKGTIPFPLRQLYHKLSSWKSFVELYTFAESNHVKEICRRLIDFCEGFNLYTTKESYVLLNLKEMGPRENENYRLHTLDRIYFDNAVVDFVRFMKQSSESSLPTVVKSLIEEIHKYSEIYTTYTKGAYFLWLEVVNEDTRVVRYAPVILEDLLLSERMKDYLKFLVEVVSKLEASDFYQYDKYVSYQNEEPNIDPDLYKEGARGEYSSFFVQFEMAVQDLLYTIRSQYKYIKNTELRDFIKNTCK